MEVRNGEEKFPEGQRIWELGGKFKSWRIKAVESILEACGVGQANGWAPPRIQSGGVGCVGFDEEALLDE